MRCHLFLLIVLIFLSQFSSAMFIQPDSRIPNVYTPQDLNRYSYVRNNPYKYVDPTGNEPVLPQIGDYNIIYGQLQAFEATQGKGTTASQTLANLVTFSGRSNSQIGDRQAFLYNSKGRYVYTSDAGFVDNLHFFTSAAKTQQSGSISAKFSGIAVEIIQKNGPVAYRDTSSAFSYEDLSSNRLGIEFASQLNNKESLSTQYKNFIESKGGSTTPLDTLNKQYPGLSANIPNSEPSGGPSFTRYSSGGKSLPKQSFFGKVANFFSGGKK